MKADPRLENRVGVFRVFTTCSDRATWTQSVGAHQETQTFDTTTASGRYPVNFVDPFGLCEDLVDNAEDNIGSKKWNQMFPLSPRYWIGENKCNKFVYDMIIESGFPDPSLPPRDGGLWRGRREPSASDWANSNVNIPGWSSPHSNPSRNDIVSDGIHVGIYTGRGTTIAVSGSQGGVAETGWQGNVARSPNP